MARTYRMNKRAEALEQTRTRILHATMALHDEKGVAETSFADVAERSGVAASTVLRHFPTIGDLVRFCGMHAWAEMNPPVPDTAAAVFEEAGSLSERLERLIDELDAFYARAAFRLKKAAQDRDRVPELAAFLGAVQAGLDALIAEALKGQEVNAGAEMMVRTVTTVEVWTALGADMPVEESRAMKLRLLSCSISSA